MVQVTPLVDSSRLDPRSAKIARNDWLERVFSIPNGKLDGTAKMVVYGISQEFLRKGVEHSQLTRVWYPNVSDECGITVQAIGDCTGKLVKAGAIMKEVRKVPDKVTKEKKRQVWIAFTPEFLTNPEALFADADTSNHGGKRIKRHKGCGGEVVNLCTTCGQVHIPDSDTYLEEVSEDGTPLGKPLLDRHGNLLPTLEEIDESYDVGGDAADIPDDIVEAMGVEEALHAKPFDIRTRMRVPRAIREGLEEDDVAVIENALDAMREGPTAQPATPVESHPAQQTLLQPPLVCHTCNNVYVDRWTFNTLRNRWECLACHASTYTLLNIPFRDAT